MGNLFCSSMWNTTDKYNWTVMKTVYKGKKIFKNRLPVFHKQKWIYGL